MPDNDVSLLFRLLGRDESAARALRNLADQADRSNRRVSALSRVGHGLGRTFVAAGRAAAVGIGALATGLGVVVAKGIGELFDFQKNMAQTNAVIASTGGAAGVSAKHVEKLASTIQGYSGQADDAIHAGANLLLTFTQIRNQAGKGNDIFDQSVRVLADMSQALGQDTKASAIQLGKALNDPIRGVTALRRVGVSFTKDQEKQIKALVESGRTLEAQKLILRELNTEFGGSAKAFGETMPGRIARMKRAFEDFAQSTLSAMMPALLPLMSGLARLATNLAPHVERAIHGIGMALRLIIGGFRDGDVTSNGWHGAMERVGVIARNVAEWFTTKLWPALVQVGQFLGTTLKEAWHSVSGAIERNKESLQKIGDFIVTKIVPVLVVALGGAIKVVGVAIGVVIDVVGTLQRVFETAFNAIKTVIEKVWDIIRPILDTMFGAIDKVVGAVGKVADVAGKVGSAVGGTAGKVGGWLNPFAANGGPVAAGVPVTVGERGRELFVPESNGTIIPDFRFGRGGGGSQAPIVVVLEVDGQRFYQKVVQPQALRHSGRNGGRNGLAPA